MTVQITVPPYEVYRGDTWVSPKYSFFNESLAEVLPEDFTQEDIDDAIASGLLTFRNWNDYVIDADVFTDNVNWFTLTDYMQIDATGRFLWFEISAQQNQDLNKTSLEKGMSFPMRGSYDIQFCKNAEVITLWKGNFTITDDITKRVVCN